MFEVPGGPIRNRGIIDPLVGRNHRAVETGILMVVFPAVVFAQNFQNMTEQDMQRMMELAQKMQACMEQVDQAQLAQLEQRSKEFEAELKALCDAGKRDEAQKKAMAYGKEMMDKIK